MTLNHDSNMPQQSHRVLIEHLQDLVSGQNETTTAIRELSAVVRAVLDGPGLRVTVVSRDESGRPSQFMVEQIPSGD